MSTVMFSLIGEQPIPNLLPVRFCTPSRVVLIHTERTNAVSLRLSALFSKAETIEVDPYDVGLIEAKLQDWMKENIEETADLLFNLTGGTKTMMLAAYRLAERSRSPFLYFQTEGRQSCLYRYQFVNGHPTLEQSIPLPGLISIEEYMSAHVSSFAINGFSTAKGGLFEAAIFDYLNAQFDQVVAGVSIGGAVDIDLAVRNGNRVGIIEAKTGASARKKSGIDQLNTAGGRAYLGTYTSKFLAIDQTWSDSQSDLLNLAEARQIHVIQLPSYGATGAISADEREYLLDIIRRFL